MLVMYWAHADTSNLLNSEFQCIFQIKKRKKNQKTFFLNFLDGKRKKEEKWIHSTETDGKEEMHVIYSLHHQYEFA